MWKLADVRKSVAWQEAFEEGLEEGIQKAKRRFARKFRAAGESLRKTAELLGVSIYQVRKWTQKEIGPGKGL